MKKLMSLIALSFCGFAALAQPTSIGGIKPGTTTRDDLKELVGYVSDKKWVSGSNFTVKLNQLKEQLAVVSIRNDVVYSVQIDLDSENAAIEKILIEKYGTPETKVGVIEKVDCRNNFGATFQRYRGKEVYLWLVKDGVQGELEYFAIGDCSKDIFLSYRLRHVATFKAIEAGESEKASKEQQERRSKFDDSLRDGHL